MTLSTTNFWQGKLIRLRAIESTDVAHIMRWNRDSERARCLDFVWPPQSETAVREWVEAQTRRKLDGNAYHWMIENQQGEAVGGIATHHCDHRDGVFSYGLDIAPEHWRKGYASEAIQIILRYYVNELRYHKASVAVHGDNEPSLRLHDKLGFTREGLFRRHIFSNGGYIDLIWFGMSDDELRRLWP